MTSREPWTYLVTDIETDGPSPGENSMMSFASVAVRADGTRLGEYEAVLEPLPRATPNPDTLRWWRSQPPEVWDAATADARPVDEVLDEFCSWVRSLPGRRVFTARPLGFDGTWFDYYLRRFTTYAVCQGPYETDRLFHGPGVCLASWSMGVLGGGLDDVFDLPASWLGDIEHTHRAIDDARGDAHLVVELARRSG